MAQRGLPISTDPLDGHIARTVHVLVAEGPSCRDSRKRLAAVHLLVDGAIFVELLRDGFPRFLRNDEDADAELRHYARRFGRHCRSIGAALERLERLGTDVDARLLQIFAVVLAVTLLETFDDHLGVFDEALARLPHVHAEAVVLDAR